MGIEEPSKPPPRHHHHAQDDDIQKSLAAVLVPAKRLYSHTHAHTRKGPLPSDTAHSGPMSRTRVSRGDGLGVPRQVRPKQEVLRHIKLR